MKMSYQEIVKDSVAYGMMEGLFVSLFRSYSFSIAGSLMQFAGKRFSDSYNKSESSSLFKSAYKTIMKNAAATTGVVRKNAMSGISSILAGSIIVKFLKLKV